VIIGEVERLIVFLIAFPHTCFRFTQFHYIQYTQGVSNVFVDMVEYATFVIFILIQFLFAKLAIRCLYQILF